MCLTGKRTIVLAALAVAIMSAQAMAISFSDARVYVKMDSLTDVNSGEDMTGVLNSVSGTVPGRGSNNMYHSGSATLLTGSATQFTGASTTFVRSRTTSISDGANLLVIDDGAHQIQARQKQDIFYARVFGGSGPGFEGDPRAPGANYPGAWTSSDPNQSLSQAAGGASNTGGLPALNKWIDVFFVDTQGTQNIRVYDTETRELLSNRPIGTGAVQNSYNLGKPMQVNSGGVYDIESFAVFSSALTEAETAELLIPEPATVALLGLGGLMLIRRRTR